MDTEGLQQGLKTAAGQLVWVGIAIAVIGALAIYRPDISGMTASVIVGVLLAAGGLLRTIVAWLSIAWGDFMLRFAIGVLTFIIGVYMIAQPDTGAQVLGMVLIAYLVVDGALTLIAAFRLPPAFGGAWTGISGALSILLGVLLWMQWPLSGEIAIGVLIGVKLLLDGGALIGIGLAGKSATD